MAVFGTAMPIQTVSFRDSQNPTGFLDTEANQKRGARRAGDQSPGASGLACARGLECELKDIDQVVARIAEYLEAPAASEMSDR